MNIELSPAHNDLINSLIESGRFSSAEEVLEEALVSLQAQETEYEAAIADVKASLKDEQAGRLKSIVAVADSIREQHGFSRPS